VCHIGLSGRKKKGRGKRKKCTVSLKKTTKNGRKEGKGENLGKNGEDEQNCANACKTIPHWGPETTARGRKTAVTEGREDGVGPSQQKKLGYPDHRLIADVGSKRKKRSYSA